MVHLLPPIVVHYFKCPSDKSPYWMWLDRCKDIVGRSKIMIRIDCLERGHLGDCKSLGHGIYELRISHGPGYRIYFGVLNPSEVVILCGGDKSTQKRDIQKAVRFLEHIKEQV